VKPIAISLVLVMVALTGVAAAPLHGPTWSAGPDKAYNCTHYLDVMAGWKSPPRVDPGEPMKLVMRTDKVMKFTLAAKSATKRGKVTFALDGAPTGAKLVKNKFEWTVAGTSGQNFNFDLVAVGDDGGRTRWPLSVTIADDKLVTAWSAGLGSVWPDCSVYADSEYEVRDLDGDGKDDVIHRTFAGDDGSTQTHVMLQRGKLKFVEAHSCFSCWPAAEVAGDGTRLLVIQDSCCCIESGTVLRFEGDRTVEAGGWQESGSCTPDPNDATTITFARDAKQRITGIEVWDGRGKVTRWRWRNKMFENP
jgi:hypothetical protein